MLNKTISYWHKELYEGKAPKYVYDYLISRKIMWNTPNIKKTGLGWSKGKTPFELSENLLFNKNTEIFRLSLVLPIIDEKRNLVGVTGRVVGSRWKQFGLSHPHLHMKGKIKGFLGEHCLKNSNYIIFVEGFFDFLTLKQHFHNVGGLLGAGGFKKDWGYKIKNVKVIYSALDQDKAGKEGTKRIAKVAKEYNIPVKRINLPTKDVNEFFVNGYNSDDFYTYMRRAETIQVERGRPFKRIVVEDSFNKMIKLMNGNGLIPNSRGYKMLCPFHNETIPSLQIYDDGISHCFSCLWSGNVVDFLIKRDGISRQEARKIVEEL